MLRSTIADIIRKGQAKAYISDTAKSLVKDYLSLCILMVKAEGFIVNEDTAICNAIRVALPEVWAEAWDSFGINSKQTKS